MIAKLVLVDGKKKCTKCSEWKPLVDFIKAVNTTTGKAAMCKVCTYAERKDKYHNDPIYRHNFQKAQKKSRLKQYGLTVEQYEAMLKEQNHKCAICFVKFNSNDINKRARVDHNHKTGKVRSLLCGPCNLGIGNFYEKEKYLMSAISYLREHK